MKSAKMIAKIFMVSFVLTSCYFFLVGIAWAHCDTTDGPVITEAKVALEKEDITPILKWVKKDNEAEIRTAFAKTVVVRTKGLEAKELADKYFFETLVRLHRAGEGAPYSGIKDEPVEPIVSLADRALADGSAHKMIKEISNHMALAIEEKFKKALEAKKNKDSSVEAGREYVEAYVTYMHYVEGIHAVITSTSGHHHAGTADTTEHKMHNE